MDVHQIEFVDAACNRLRHLRSMKETPGNSKRKTKDRNTLVVRGLIHRGREGCLAGSRGREDRDIDASPLLCPAEPQNCAWRTAIAERRSKVWSYVENAH